YNPRDSAAIPTRPRVGRRGRPRSPETRPDDPERIMARAPSGEPASPACFNTAINSEERALTGGRLSRNSRIGPCWIVSIISCLYLTNEQERGSRVRRVLRYQGKNNSPQGHKGTQRRFARSSNYQITKLPNHFSTCM